MATTPALMSIEQYLRTPFHPDVDFVDGEIQERNLGESDHAQMQWLIASILGSRQEQWGISGRIEQRIRVAPNKVRICDVSLLRADAPYERVTETAPLVCIEVRSPEDRISRAKLVLADYYAMGVPHIWFLDPIEKCAYVYDGTDLKRVEGEELSVQGTPIRLNFRELYERLDSGNA